jgi:predicted component of type VI protein secretion system
MNLRLVVASGVHQGKAIPITTPQFVIGRDPQCQLRPASSAISKRHCALLVRGGRVFVRDFGSTNGTFVNDQLVQGEVEIHDGDRFKVGPLDFTVALETTPAAKPAAAAAASATKPAAASVSEDDDAVDLGAKAAPTDGPASDKMAALLLGGEDGASAEATNQTQDHPVPDGSTVVELPAANKPGAPDQAKQKSVVGTGNTSQAAADILSKYYRRPRS